MAGIKIRCESVPGDMRALDMISGTAGNKVLNLAIDRARANLVAIAASLYGCVGVYGVRMSHDAAYFNGELVYTVVLYGTPVELLH